MTTQQEVALFPIPSLVAFPGTVVPLHVFEPRYRRLIHDCVSDQRMVGVCHVSKTLREAPANQSRSELMTSNQANYLPQPVFSAGHCKIIETTGDGRILAEVSIEHRLQITRERQSLPYRIVMSEPVSDRPATAAEKSENSQLQDQINARLLGLIGADHPDFINLVTNPAWTGMSPDELSFKLFQFLRFEPDMMQTILESRSTFERLSIVWDCIKQ